MTDYVSQADVNTANTMKLLGSVYESWMHALAEVVANSRDGAAQNIWIELYPDRIVVTDDGQGMVPDMTEEGKELLRMFREDIKAGRVTPDTEIRKIIGEVSPASLSSLRWMMECIAFSPKISRPGSGVQGMLGIGANSFRQFADKAVWLTRSSRELAREFWGNDPKTQSRPAYILEPPTNGMLDRYDITYKVTQSSESVRGPDGKVLDSGTRVVIHDLKRGSEAGSRPAAFADYCKSRFGGDISRRKFKLKVIDYVTEEGRRLNGREIEVQSVAYKGINVFKGMLYLGGTKNPFEVELYYDPQSKASLPKLRRKGNDVSDLTKLDEFAQLAPFNTGKLAGFVEFPEVEDEDKVWNPSKTMPIDTDTRASWRHQVLRIVPEINEAIKEIEERAKRQSSENIAKEIREATLQAINELEAYQDLSLGVTRRGRVTTSPTHQPLDGVYGAVYNEHNRGVVGVGIELFRGKSRADLLATGVGGRVSFGLLPKGWYTLKIVLPEGTKAVGPTEFNFGSSVNDVVYRAVFHIWTGQPAPKKTGVPRFSLFHHAFDDPDNPYLENLEHFGLVEINTEHAAFKKADSEGDDEYKRILNALYTAQAVTEYALKGYKPELQARNASRLFTRILEITKERKSPSRKH